MGKEDSALKTYLSANHRFAKLFNESVFGGKEIIKADKLKEVDTTLAEIIPLKDGHDEVIQKSRDIIKIYDDQIELVILGIENQHQIDYRMPLRVMLYDALVYEKQSRNIQTEHRRKGDLQSKEWTSGFKKEDRLIPVLTLVVYYGIEEWDGPRALKEMLSINNTEFQHLIPDYPMHLLEVKKIEKLEEYGDELLPLFAFVKYQKEREALESVVKTHQALFEHIDQETYLAIKNVVDLKEMDQYIHKYLEKEGGINMCDALQEMVDAGRNEGRAEGRIEGRDEAFMEVAKNLLKQNHPIPDIMQLTHLTEEQINELKKHLH